MSKFPFQQLSLPLFPPTLTIVLYIIYVNELIPWISCRSAGCVFVEMIQGQPIFAATSGAHEQLEKIWEVSKIHSEMEEKRIHPSSLLNFEVLSMGPVNSRNNLV